MTQHGNPRSKTLKWRIRIASDAPANKFYPSGLFESFFMLRFLLLGLLSISIGAQAAYPLGTMTCDDIASFASEAMSWRKDGQTREQALAALEERTYNDPVEKKNLAAIVDLVFGSYGNNWTVESAGNVMRTDCMT
jgi:hypothetical protein